MIAIPAENVDYLRKLRRATDAAIRRVCSYPRRPPGAVNWADLRCIQAAMVITDDGESYIGVSIEEASPDATNFRRAVELELASDGWSEVQVVTEW